MPTLLRVVTALSAVVTAVCAVVVAVIEGTTFTCTFSDALGQDTDVAARVTDTDSGALEVGEPKSRR